MVWVLPRGRAGETNTHHIILLRCSHMWVGLENMWDHIFNKGDQLIHSHPSAKSSVYYVPFSHAIYQCEQLYFPLLYSKENGKRSSANEELHVPTGNWWFHDRACSRTGNFFIYLT
jgi:hypothetical protein